MNRATRSSTAVEKKRRVWLSGAIVSMSILLCTGTAHAADGPGAVDVSHLASPRNITVHAAGKIPNGSASSRESMPVSKDAVACTPDCPCSGGSLVPNCPGVIDVTFGTFDAPPPNGRTITDVGMFPKPFRTPNSDDKGHAVAVQKDGKIVATGWTDAPCPPGPNDPCVNNFGTVRYNTDGTVDTTFNGNGAVLTTFQNAPDRARNRAWAIAIQADQKIVVCGDSDAPTVKNGGGGDLNFALVRYNPDGTIDTSFGINGGVLTTFSDPLIHSQDECHSVLVQPDGKIVAVGFTDASILGPHLKKTNNFAIARYNPDGKLDTTFGVNGGTVLDFFFTPGGPLGAGPDISDSQAYGVALQTDGKIVVAGYSNAPGRAKTTNPCCADVNFAVVRLNTNGTLDTSFGDNAFDPGKVLTDFRQLLNGDQSDDYGRAVAIQLDGKIVVAGYSNAPNTLDCVCGDLNFALARYDKNGVIDSAFGGSVLNPGRVLTDFRQLPDLSHPNDSASSVVIQQDQKIIAGGFTESPNGDLNFALARYNTDGVIDVGYGSSHILDPGRVMTDFGSMPNQTAEQIWGIALQGDGKLVVVGQTNAPGPADENYALARYWP